MNAVEYISTFSRLGKKLDDLHRIEALLSAVGEPQSKLRFIHIAGTNGKGSMAQMFSEILTDAGYTTGLFTSPYIVKYSDRIKINGKNIPYDELEAIVEKLKPILEAHPMRNEFSQFEITQAVAFTYFAKRGCDAVVLETGLGGRLDSTNVIEKPIVSVIGSVAFDHMAILGDTLEKIAYQKAGIIKPHCPCVLSAGNAPEVMRVFRETAAENESQLNIPIATMCIVKKSSVWGSVFTYRGEEYETSMGGLKQVSNAITVIDAMKFVNEVLPVSRENIRNGIKNARLFGRIEVIGKEPLTILDGAHNPDGTAALADALSRLDVKNITAVIGMHKDKNSFEAVKKLVPFVSSFTAVDGFSELDRPKEELAELIVQAGGAAQVGEEDIMSEIRRLRNENPDGAVVICGSLYLVAYVKNHDNI